MFNIWPGGPIASVCYSFHMYGEHHWIAANFCKLLSTNKRQFDNRWNCHLFV